MAASRRVVVTGLGAVSSLGVDITSNWASLMSGQAKFSKLSHESFDDSEVRIGAEISGDFDEKKYCKAFPGKSKVGGYSAKAAEEAIADSGIKFNNVEEGFRAGVIHSPGFSGAPDAFNDGVKIAKKGSITGSDRMIGVKILSNIISGVLSGQIDFRGPISAIGQGSVSGAVAISDAFSHIKLGYADYMIAGAGDHTLDPNILTALNKIGYLNAESNGAPELACRPFDRAAKGYVMGDGSGMLILEDYEHAKARGAEIYCELKGVSLAADGRFLTKPEETGKGLKRAMQDVMRKGEVSEIDLIASNGSSNAYEDRAELTAISSVFSGYTPWITALKSQLGHTYHASTILESVFAIKALQEGQIPGIRNLDEEAVAQKDKRRYKFVKEGQDQNIDNAMVTVTGYGGQNAAILFSKI